MIGSDNMPVTGPINADGTYAVAGVPAGTVRVALVSPDPAGRMRSRGIQNPTALTSPRKARRQTAPEIDRSKWFPLPLEYELADNSGITTTIQEGDNTFDIDLK
jgi:hypothetical protein